MNKGFIKENGQEWYYEYYVIDKEKPTIILLHEGLGSVAQWKKWPVQLQNKLQMNVLVYDRTGYGKSSPAPAKYPFDYLRYEAREIFPNFLNHFNIERAHIFGHSDGGTIALLAAAFHPERVLSVISEAAHVIIEDISVNGIRETKNIYEEKLKRPLNKYHRDKTDWVFYHWADTWLKPDFFDWNMIKELQKIKCPVLAIQGKKDEYGSFEQLNLIQKNSFSKLLFLKDCGHHPHFEQAEKVLAETDQFLRNL
jgi:pimeloyl-ACP methyl ester carboxylesterase